MGTSTQVKEAAGIYFDTASLENAVVELLDSGFESERLGLLASEKSVEDILGDIYVRTHERLEAAESPVTAYVMKEAENDTRRFLGGNLFFAGSILGGGFAVASIGVLGGALIPALIGAATAGGVGAAAASIINESDAKYLEEQVKAGHLVLLVQLGNPRDEKLAQQILARHSGFDVRICQLQIKK